MTTFDEQYAVFEDAARVILKEQLVAAGEAMMREAEKNGIELDLSTFRAEVVVDEDGERQIVVRADAKQ